MNPALISSEIIASKIYFLRGERILLDSDLASLFGVETRALNQAVRRNIRRFPGDFMFELSKHELSNLKSQIVISSWGGRRKPPLAFTEQGVAMPAYRSGSVGRLSSVLKSHRAIDVNIAIMRTFVALRHWMQSNKELATKIRLLENKYDSQFKLVFDAIQQLIHEEAKETRPIGFRIKSKPENRNR